MNTESGYLLVAEDDPDIRKLLYTTLTFKGYRVVAAHNGREGLEFIQKERPLIVIQNMISAIGLVMAAKWEKALRYRGKSY